MFKIENEKVILYDIVKIQYNGKSRIGKVIEKEGNAYRLSIQGLGLICVGRTDIISIVKRHKDHRDIRVLNVNKIHF